MFLLTFYFWQCIHWLPHIIHKEVMQCLISGLILTVEVCEHLRR